MKKLSFQRDPSKKEKPHYPKEIKGIIIFMLSLTMALSLLSFKDGDPAANWLGFLGFSFSWVFQYLFGLGGYLVVLYMIWISWKYIRGNEIEGLFLKTCYFFLALLSLCVLFNLFAEMHPELADYFSSFVYSEAVTYRDPVPYRVIRYHLGGVPLYYLYRDLPGLNLRYLLSNLGTFLVFLTVLLTSIMMMAGVRSISFRAPFRGVKKFFLFFFSYFKNRKGRGKNNGEANRFIKVSVSEGLEEEGVLSRSAVCAVSDKGSTGRSSILKRREKGVQESEGERNLTSNKKDKSFASPLLSHKSAHFSRGSFPGNFKPPHYSLLVSPKKVDQPALKKNLQRQAEVLEETFQSFGIEAKVGEINCGPTITSFEVHPAVGVKVQKIKTLENDIALNLEARSIRIIAPIPGKAAVGIEVPNLFPQEVSFKEMMDVYQRGKKRYAIPILLGKTVHGSHVTADLAKMPHCIIAGATGSGKSVCINTIVMSILMNAHPDEIKMLMIDPKKVELTPYAKLPHMVAPVITEPQGACAALNWLVKEMELRYEILKYVGLRNIASFNHRKIDRDLENASKIPIPEKMSYIVGIIDELADLMIVSSSDIETPIARIAQMARAVGIHLILATQRPSREVITGLIKANFPTRISFKVSSRVNSQIILDETGAETLLGNGDMLFLPPDSSNLIRAQGAYIRDEDINKVVTSICDQASPNYLIKSFDRFEEDASFSSIPKEEKELDSLYNEARDLVLKTGNASTTFLQRKLKVGYARAASLMDQLEEMGLVSEQEGSKPRKVLAKTSEDDSSPREDTN